MTVNEIKHCSKSKDIDFGLTWVWSEQTKQMKMTYMALIFFSVKVSIYEYFTVMFVYFFFPRIETSILFAFYV
jgi:hypothetical protein